MSGRCGLKYFEMWNACHKDKTISQEDLNKWMSEHCDKCKYMSDICMYDELTAIEEGAKKHTELINNYMKLVKHDAMQVFPNASTVEVTINSDGVTVRVYYPDMTVVSHHLGKEDIDG